MAMPNQSAVVMEYVNRASHCGTRLRLVSREDAEFIVSLRSNERLNRHISATSDDVEQQRRWIDSYLGRFNLGMEAYFIITHAGHSCGTIRMYDYDIDAGSFVYGSWLISPEAPSSCAYSSTILNHDLGFSVLGFSKVCFEVRKENKSVCGFHRLIEASLIREDEINFYYEITSAAYPQVRAKLEKFAHRFHERTPS